MTFIDIFQMSLTNLTRRKVRTLLTSLAMAIGVAAIVVLVSVGIGYNKNYQESIEKMGSITKIDVMPSAKSKGRVALLNEKAVESLKKLEGVEAVTPVLLVTPYLKVGNYATPIRMYGIDMKTASNFQLDPLEGDLPDGGTKMTSKILLTNDVQKEFADPETWKTVENEGILKTLDPMKNNVRFTFDYDVLVGRYEAGEDGRAQATGKMYNTQVTGICDNLNNTYTTSAFIDYKILEAIMKDNPDNLPIQSFSKDPEEDERIKSKMGKTYGLVWVKATSTNTVQGVVDIIREAGFETVSLNDMVEFDKKQSRQIQGMLAAIGGVSLLVAGIGTANTMMMAINERTKEIGVLKVLGMELSDIRRIFLTESALIGVIGGIVGLVFSFSLQLVLPKLLKDMNVTSVIPLWLALGGVVFASFVAIVSALIPANQAMKVSPQVAIRTE